MAKPTILVVDDQPEYARLITLSLAKQGFEVHTAGGGDEAIETATELHPDAVLLDVHMPGSDGYEVLSALRERWPVPVIMVTADDRLEDRRDGLDRGADDYVTKPFSPVELAARVRAVIRRSVSSSDAAPALTVLPSNPPSPGRRALALRHPIGRGACRLLEILAANPDKVLYHDELLAHAFGPAFVGDSTLLQEQVRRLRRALGVRPGSEGPIRTVRGVGYAFDASGRRPVRRASPRGRVRRSGTKGRRDTNTVRGLRVPGVAT